MATGSSPSRSRAPAARRSRSTTVERHRLVHLELGADPGRLVRPHRDARRRAGRPRSRDARGAQDVTPIADGVRFVAPPGANVVCTFTNSKRPMIKVLKSSVGWGRDVLVHARRSGWWPGEGRDDRVVARESATWGPDGLVAGRRLHAHRDRCRAGGCRRSWSARTPRPTRRRPIGTPLDQGVGVSLPKVPAGAVIECSFTNTKRPMIKVLKSSTGGDGTFTFTLAGRRVRAARRRRDDGAERLGLARGIQTASTSGGDYTLTETVQDDWVSDVRGVREHCDDPARRSDAPRSQVSACRSLDVPAGAVVDCSFTNTKRPTVKVLEVEHRAANGTFAFDARWSTGDRWFDAERVDDARWRGLRDVGSRWPRRRAATTR